MLPGFHIHSVPAHADYWEIEKRKWQEPVLLAKPWLDLGFAKAARELARHADEGGPLIAALTTWLDSLEGLLVPCRERLLALAAQLAAEPGKAGLTTQLESHPQKALLHLAARGRLELDAVRQRCATPRKLLELATQLGITPPIASPVPLH